MKKTLAILLLFILVCSASATHFPPKTGNAVKRLAHNDKFLYILHWDGLEVLEKATGKSVCYTQATGHIPEGNSPKLNALAIHGDTVWTGGDGYLTAFVGSEAQSWGFKYNNELYKLGMRFISIVFDSKGTMYLGGFDQIGYLKAPGKAKFIELPDNYRWGTEVWQMLVDKDDVVWVSYTSDSGDNSLVKYTAGGEVEEVSSKLGLGNNIKAMTLDKDNNLWFGTNHDSKLYRYDRGSLEEYEVGGSHASSFRGICCMSFDNKERLWLLHSNCAGYDNVHNKDLDGYEHWSKGPLCRFADGETAEYPFPEGVGLAYCIDVDGEDVYVGTDKGVLKLVDGELVLLESPWYSSNQESTAIEGCKISQADEKPHGRYDLQGRRHESGRALNGIHIENGRKTLIHSN